MISMDEHRRVNEILALRSSGSYTHDMEELAAYIGKLRGQVMDLRSKLHPDMVISS